MKSVKCILNSNSPEQTEKYGELIAKNLKGGEAFQLISDLGGGKTTFTKGFVKGANSKDLVNSPTFTISKEYKGSKFNIYHFDFYRLQDPGIVANELAESVLDPKAVVIIEWADSVIDVLPEDTIKITLDSVQNNSRNITVLTPANRLYIIENLFV